MQTTVSSDMTLEPIDLANAHKTGVRTQFGAVCFRMMRGKPEILLITSRRNGRWIVPKGWPMDGKTPAEAAEIEAWEEAGVRGKVHERCLGLYSHLKVVGDGPDIPCVTMLYAIKVRELASVYPEAHQRKRKWVKPKKAAKMVEESDLAYLLRNFNPVQAKM